MFKVGDVVWCVVQGRGIVTSVGNSTLTVKCDKLPNNVYYYLDGRLYEQGGRCLYFSEPVITAETERPFEPTLKKGDLVVVRRLASEDSSLPGVIQVQKETKISVISIFGSVYLKSEYEFSDPIHF